MSWNISSPLQKVGKLCTTLVLCQTRKLRTTPSLTIVFGFSFAHLPRLKKVNFAVAPDFKVAANFKTGNGNHARQIHCIPPGLLKFTPAPRPESRRDNRLKGRAKVYPRSLSPTDPVRIEAVLANFRLVPSQSEFDHFAIGGLSLCSPWTSVPLSS